MKRGGGGEGRKHFLSQILRLLTVGARDGERKEEVPHQALVLVWLSPLPPLCLTNPFLLLLLLSFQPPFSSSSSSSSPFHVSKLASRTLVIQLEAEKEGGEEDAKKVPTITFPLQVSITPVKAVGGGMEGKKRKGSRQKKKMKFWDEAQQVWYVVAVSSPLLPTCAVCTAQYCSSSMEVGGKENQKPRTTVLSEVQTIAERLNKRHPPFTDGVVCMV